MNFVVQSLNHKVRVMVEGECRKYGRSLLEMCKQEEVKGDDNTREEMGNIKVAELSVEEEENILSASVHDSKPVRFEFFLR